MEPSPLGKDRPSSADRSPDGRQPASSGADATTAAADPADGADPTDPTAGAGQPRVWLVLGDKQGDNAQVEVVAKALGWACERKRVAMQARFAVAKPRVRPTLDHIDESRSDPLEPPWPDLILTVGRRPAMVALWIRERTRGRARIVLIGKPSGRVEWYDLIVAGSEVVLPPLPNVLAVTLPLMGIDERALAGAAEAWRARLDALPRPLIGFLIGGPTNPYVYTRAMIERLLQAARDLMREQGGTPYLTTSRRTPAWVVAALRAGLPSGGRLHVWTPDAEENPYLGLLALADGVVVTGDSISMMVEAIKVGKPVAVLPTPTGPLGALDQLRRTLVRRLFAAGAPGGGGGLRRAAALLLYRLRLATQTRDFRAFHRQLFARGLAVPLAGPPSLAPPAGLPDDVAVVAARIKALAAG